MTCTTCTYVRVILFAWLLCRSKFRVKTREMTGDVDAVAAAAREDSDASAAIAIKYESVLYGRHAEIIGGNRSAFGVK